MYQVYQFLELWAIDLYPFLGELCNTSANRVTIALSYPWESSCDIQAVYEVLFLKLFAAFETGVWFSRQLSC